PAGIEVLSPGAQSSLQELPGRIGLWHVGVPPSGPMDARSFRAANALVGNPGEMAALELTVNGPSLRFLAPARIALAGAEMAMTLDGQPLPHHRAVNIPAGVETGTRIRLGGEGEAGLRGGPTGDLYIFIEVRDHPIFQRDGAHLFCRVPLSMATAALGGDIEVPTIDGGRSKVKVPAGSQTGRQMRLRGKGMPALRGGGIGDMLIELA
ncbi:hypothetical protein FGG78_40550, partial [Thioclava sp. BHET1]